MRKSRISQVRDLQEHVVDFTFRKTSGKIRRIVGTLHPDIKPEYKNKTGRRRKVVPRGPGATQEVAVWSIHDADWRSYKWKNVLQWKVVL